MDYNQLNAHELIGAYVLECRGKGTTLPYEDLDIIRHWLKMAPDVDALLVVLSEILPDYYESRSGASVLPGLKRVDQKVRKHLEALNARARGRI